jgi:hypothetical protein
MSVLTHCEPPAKIKGKTIPSFTARAPRIARKIALQQGNFDTLVEDDRCQRIWGVHLKKFEAEDLLDWLEANGRSGSLSYAPGEGFTVC